EMGEHPNLLIIMCDQLSPGVLGCYGGPVPTPNLDALARDGVIFTNATCPTPICSPSRASLITGLYPHTHGIVYNVNRPDYPAISPKIDFPPDSYLQMLKYCLSYADLEHLFITHTHQDHLYALDLRMRASPFSLTDLEELYIYGNRTVYQGIKQRVGDLDKSKLVVKAVEPFASFRAGELEVTPILANHDPKEVCLNYIFQFEGKTLLQGFDTGWYPERTWERLADYRFDMVIMDCTSGGVEKDIHPQGHLGVKSLIEVKKRMEKMGILAPDCRFIATHFSRGGGLLHHELEERLKPWGIEVAYDGMEVEI
ncbi:MAG TPA: hypothetical protein EYP53_01945, partial [Candidatus Latescibacteria bacterium]|nr:hypothetical protein [Candidatus Latescibacterota bacterium]